MTWTPRLEFTGNVFPSGIAQLHNDLWIVGGKPVLQFVQRFHTVQHRPWNDDILFCHGSILNGFRRKSQSRFCFIQTNPTAAAGRVV